MVYVEFNDVEVYTSDNENQALSFAVTLHQSSNAKHKIDCYDDDKHVTVILIKD